MHECIVCGINMNGTSSTCANCTAEFAASGTIINPTANYGQRSGTYDVAPEPVPGSAPGLTPAEAQAQINEVMLNQPGHTRGRFYGHYPDLQPQSPLPIEEWERMRDEQHPGRFTNTTQAAGGGEPHNRIHIRNRHRIHPDFVSTSSSSVGQVRPRGVTNLDGTPWRPQAEVDEEMDRELNARFEANRNSGPWRPGFSFRRRQ